MSSAWYCFVGLLVYRCYRVECVDVLRNVATLYGDTRFALRLRDSCCRDFPGVFLTFVSCCLKQLRVGADHMCWKTNKVARKITDNDMEGLAGEGFRNFASGHCMLTFS